MFRDLEKLPGSSHLHRWADWAELLCIFDGSVSAPNLGSEIERRQDSIHVEVDDDPEPGNPPPEPLKTPFESQAEFNDAVTQRANDTFALLAARAQDFGDSYPFALDASGRRLKLKPLRPDRAVYAFLLACSSFRYIATKQLQTEYAARFEWLALQVFRAQLPLSAEAHIFGATPYPGSRYNSGLKERIKSLAKDIREEVLVDLDKNFPSDSGDNGLDLVAWQPMTDKAAGLSVAFGQCACTPQWVGKQHSSSRAAWNPVFRFTVAPVNYCFIPFDFRDTDGDWYMRVSVQESVVMDRRRFMASLEHIIDSDGNVNFDADVALQVNVDDILTALKTYDWPSDESSHSSPVSTQVPA